MIFCGFIYLTIRMGEFRVKVPFRVVQNLAVDRVPGTSFVEHHVNIFLPRLRKLVFYCSISVALTGQRSLTKPETSLARELENGFQNFGTT